MTGDTKETNKPTKHEYRYLTPEEMEKDKDNNSKRTEYCTQHKKCMQDIEPKETGQKWSHKKLHEVEGPCIDKSRAWTPGYLPEKGEKDKKTEVTVKILEEDTTNKYKLEEETIAKYLEDKKIEENSIPRDQWCKCRFCREMEGWRQKVKGWRPGGLSGLMPGAEDIGINVRRDCDACGYSYVKLEFAPASRDLRDFAFLIKRAGTMLETERMIREMDEASSKRQYKKIKKKIRKRQAKLTAAYDQREVLREERARTNREKRRKEGKPKRTKQTDNSSTSGTDIDSNHTRDSKEKKNMEKRKGTDQDKEEDQNYEDAIDKLIESLLVWKISADEEMKAQEEIVTISSSEDSDFEEHLARGARCKCNKGHRKKAQIVACIARKDYEDDVIDWGEYVKELGKAIGRDKISNRTLATALRMGAQEIGERKEKPMPSFEGAALRPEAQECHQGDLYQEARLQARREGPPLYTYVYDSTQDSW